MIGLKLDKSWFFDRLKVQRAVGDATRRVLSKFGAFVRTAARHSIRKRKAVSQPGNPPSSHTGLLRNRIYFAYDPARQSVVIGPTPINQVTFDRDIKPVSGIVPEILEYGGSAGGPASRRRSVSVRDSSTRPASFTRGDRTRGCSSSWSTGRSSTCPCRRRLTRSAS